MPAIAYSCTRCRDSFRVMSNQAGMKVRCPHCGAVNTVSRSVFAGAAAGKPASERGVPMDGNGYESPSRAPADAHRIAEPDTHTNPLGAIAAAAQRSNHQLAVRSLYRSRMAYTHSALAKITSVVAKATLIVALLVEIYVLITTDWSGIADLPMKYAVPAYALTLFPAAAVAITGLLLLTTAHGLEYLARIAAEREGG